MFWRGGHDHAARCPAGGSTPSATRSCTRCGCCGWTASCRLRMHVTSSSYGCEHAASASLLTLSLHQHPVMVSIPGPPWPLATACKDRHICRTCRCALAVSKFVAWNNFQRDARCVSTRVQGEVRNSRCPHLTNATMRAGLLWSSPCCLHCRWNFHPDSDGAAAGTAESKAQSTNSRGST